MYAKWGVSPRITAPRQMMASYRRERANRDATRGISNAPGTSTTSIASSRAPPLRKASSAPSSSRFVTSSLNRLRTIANRSPAAVPPPSIIVAIRYVLCLRSDLIEEVTQFDLLRSQVANVRVLRRNLDWHALDNPEPIPLHTDDLPGIVGDQPDLVQSQLHEDLRADPVVPQVRLEAEGQIGLDGVLAFVLQLVRPQLVHQADAAPLLVQVEEHPLPHLLDHLQRVMELLTAVAAERPEHIGREAAGMHADQDLVVRFDRALDQRDMGAVIQVVFEDIRDEVAKGRRELGLCHLVDEGLPLHPVLDQVLDRDQLEMVPLGDLLELRHTGHGPVVVHDLAQNAGRVEPSQARQVHRALGLPRPL